MTAERDTWDGRAILHLDLDAFFASVEQLDHPEWRGRPLLVGGSPEGRGVVSAASYEARAYGCRSAMPSAQAARLCPDAVWARPRFRRYSELSRAVMSILHDRSAFVQQVSIDEAYLDVTPTAHRKEHPVSAAEAIQTAVDALGLSCSIGVATSKTVAKIASDRDKPHGITVVEPGAEAAFLAPLPCRTLPGIGGRTATALRDAGITTLGQLAALDESTATAILGSAGADLRTRARGVDDRPVRGGEDVKSVSHEHTFPADVRERAEVERALSDLASRVARRLRSKGLAGRTGTVKLRYADFTTKTASRTLSSPTDLEAELIPLALGLLGEAWTPGAGLRLLGFGVSGFGSAARQLGLLEPADDAPRQRALERSIDAVKERFGDGAIMHAGEIREGARDEEPPR